MTAYIHVFYFRLFVMSAMARVERRRVASERASHACEPCRGASRDWRGQCADGARQLLALQRPPQCSAAL